jgi:hypothetical protein
MSTLLPSRFFLLLLLLFVSHRSRPFWNGRSVLAWSLRILQIVHFLSIWEKSISLRAFSCCRSLSFAWRILLPLNHNFLSLTKLKHIFALPNWIISLRGNFNPLRIIPLVMRTSRILLLLSRHLLLIELLLVLKLKLALLNHHLFLSHEFDVFLLSCLGIVFSMSLFDLLVDYSNVLVPVVSAFISLVGFPLGVLSFTLPIITVYISVLNPLRMISSMALKVLLFLFGIYFIVYA